MISLERRTAIVLIGIPLLVLIWLEPAHAVFRIWEPVNFSVDWNTAANWDPNGVPTTNDTVQVSNAGVAPVLSASTAAVNSLVITRNTMQTNGHRLSVLNSGNGLLTINGVNGQAGLRVIEAPSSVAALVADDVLIQSDGTLTMANDNVFAEVGEVMTIGVGGTLRTTGAGTKVVTYFNVGSNSNVLVNGGVISAEGGTTTLTGPSFVDLDGSLAGSGTGEVHVGSGATLIVDVNVRDFFNVMSIGGSGALATLDIRDHRNFWTNRGQINLDNGELTGVSLSNAGTISGHGTITADNLINFGTLAADGGTLVIDTPVQPDFDGTGGSGIVNALTGDLDLSPLPGGSFFFPIALNVGGGHQANMGDHSFLPLTGSVVHLSGGILTGRFFNFLPGSTLQVDCCDESRLDHGQPGDPNVPSVLSGNVQLDGALRVTGEWRVAATSSFTGNGQLIVDDADSLYVPDGTTFGASLRSEGNLLLDDFDATTINQTDVGGNYTQTETGFLPIDVAGVVPGQFDSLAVDGNIDLDGVLEVRVNENFEPNLGNTFTILTSEFGTVEGEFATENVPVFDGLTFDVIYDPNSVVLEVVEAGIPGDWDADGDADGDDFLLWQRDPSVGDLADWEAYYGMVAPITAAASAVPEPAALAQFALASLALMRRGRKRSK